MTLRFYEHYFTASRMRGGFFTLDRSAGLSPEEVDELEKKGEYNPPLRLPGEPSEDDIRRLFPECVAYYRLRSSGRYAFLHSVYTGRTNHTPNRFGNFFSHSLILQEGEPVCSAKLVFDKAVFRTSLSLEEDAAYQSSLSTCEIDIDPEDATSRQSVFRGFVDFLQAHPKGSFIFARIFDLIVGGKIARRGYNIIIRDQKENLSDWVLAVNFFLPQVVANKISFASYVCDPKKNLFEIAGIVPECGNVRLDEQYSTLVDALKDDDYTSKHEYTACLLRIITQGKYEHWQLLLELLDAFEVTAADDRMNAPAKICLVLMDIENKGLEDVKVLLGPAVGPARSIVERTVRDRNPDIYLAFILEQLARRHSFEEREQAYLQLYREQLSANEHFRRTVVTLFNDAYLDMLPADEKRRGALSILLQTDVKESAPVGHLHALFWHAASFFDDDKVALSEKMGMIAPFIERYKAEEIGENAPILRLVMELFTILRSGQPRRILERWESYRPLWESDDADRQSRNVYTLFEQIIFVQG